MNKIDFDNYGNLSPYEVIETDLQSFQLFFVEKMENVEHRDKLFQDYLNYTKVLSKLVSNQFFQWINGSFVTQKNKPRDIDVASFIDYQLIEKSQQELSAYLYPLSREIYNVDAYIVKMYPDNDMKAVYSKSGTLYWFHHFQKTKPNKNGEKYYKGFVKIDLSHEKL